jgi:hypothetical protein
MSLLYWILAIYIVALQLLQRLKLCVLTNLKPHVTKLPISIFGER